MRTQTILHNVAVGIPRSTVTIEDLVAENDKVAARFTFSGTQQGDFMNIPATGRQVIGNGMDLCRIEDGKITELWGQLDVFGLLEQLSATSDAP